MGQRITPRYICIRLATTVVAMTLSGGNIMAQIVPEPTCNISSVKESRVSKMDDKKALKFFKGENDLVSSERFASTKLLIYHYPPNFGYHILAPSIETSVGSWQIILWMEDNPTYKKVHIAVDRKIFEFPLFDIPDYKGCTYISNGVYSGDRCTTWEKSQFELSKEARIAILENGGTDSLSVKFVLADGTVTPCGVTIYPREFALMNKALQNLSARQ